MFHAVEVAHETLKLLGGAGVFAIEMFAIGNTVAINEIAPRVHNSGHLTIEANQTSRFEQHIRAITGMPLGAEAMRAPAAVMINIIGSRDEPLTREGLSTLLAIPDTHPHFYDKSSRPGRKICHITVLGRSIAEALPLAKLKRGIGDMRERLRVSIIMGSDRDLKVMRHVGRALATLGLEAKSDYEERVISAHRTPRRTAQFAAEARDRGLKVIVAGAVDQPTCRGWSRRRLCYLYWAWQ